MTEKEIKKINKGCLFGSLGSISLLAILLALAIPSFEGISNPAVFSYKVKNGLRRGIKECFIREAENKTTRFKDVMSFRENYEQFKIQPIDPNSCFQAKAVPTNDQNTWDETMREGFDNMRLMN